MYVLGNTVSLHRTISVKEELSTMPIHNPEHPKGQTAQIFRLELKIKEDK